MYVLQGQGALRLVEETITCGVYADLLMDVIPETYERLNIRPAILLEDHAGPHDTPRVKDIRSELSLRLLEDYPL